MHIAKSEKIKKTFAFNVDIFIYALQLQFGKAFYYHPLFWMMPFLVLLYLFWGKLAARVQKIIAWTAIVCFAAVYFLRLFSPGQDVVVADLEAGLLGRLWKSFM